MEEKKYIFQDVSISKIQVNPQENREINSKKLQELQENIEIHGLMHPICVEKIEDNDIYQYLLLAGERRLNVFKNLGMATIPAHIYEPGRYINMQDPELNDDETDTSEKKRQYFRLAENLSRQDMSEKEKAKEVHRLYANGETSYRKLAAKLGLSKSYVQKLCKLATGDFQLPPRDVIDLVNVRSSIQKINILLEADITADNIKELEKAVNSLKDYIKQIKTDRSNTERKNKEFEATKRSWLNEEQEKLSSNNGE